MNPSPRPTPLVLTFCLFLVGLAFWHCQAAAVQEPPVSDEYAMRVWDVNDGLPTNHIAGMAQTPDGYLWLATWWGGLVRFDGAKFTSFPKTENPGLPSDRAQSVYVTKDGTLWVGMEHGAVARFRNQQFETIAPIDTSYRTNYLVSSLAEDAEGGVWISYDPERIVARWKEGKLMAFSKIGGPKPKVHLDENGRVWLSMYDCCSVFDGKGFKEIDRGNFAGRLSLAKGGGMWAVKDKCLLRYYEDGKKEKVADLPWMQDVTKVSVVYTDRDGALWIGTKNEGLYRYRDGSTVKVPTSHSDILSILEDREGNLWVGTEGGLNRLRLSAFSLRKIKNGLLHDSVVSLAEDPDKSLWLLGRDGIAVHSTDAEHRWFVWEKETPELILSVGSDSEKGIWLCGDGLHRLVHWYGGLFHPEPPSGQFTSVFVDHNKEVWAGAIRGPLVHGRDGKYSQVPMTNGMVETRALAEDQAGRIWVGTEQGLVFYKEGDDFVRVFLPNPNPEEHIRFIVVDNQGAVWIGTFATGLYRWQNGKVDHLPPQVSFPGRDLRCLIIDPEQDFWFGTGTGLFRVARHELEAAMEGRSTPMRTISYGRNDGLPSVDYSFGFRNATARTQDGHLWFATYSGGLEIVPWKCKSPVQPVPVLIEKMAVGGNPVVNFGQGNLVLPPQVGPVRIDFTLPQLSAPEQIHFRYRLLGLSEEWIPMEGQRSVVFPRLEPGSYRFEVSGAEGNSAWLPPASVSFSVQAAWWETVWFRAIGGLIGAAGVAWVVRLIVKRRLRARIRRLEQERALERERSRIARDMHDEFGASLTQISLSTQLAQMEPPEAAARHIHEIEQITRRTVASLDELVWAVNPRNDNLAALLDHLSQYTYDYLRSAGIDCEVEVPQVAPDIALNAHVRHHLLLAVKEALNNVVKHSQATSVSLRAQFELNLLQIMIADNGCGFDAKPAALGADGLRNFHDRMSEVDGSCRIESSPGKGTRITFELPLHAPGA